MLCHFVVLCQLDKTFNEHNNLNYHNKRQLRRSIQFIVYFQLSQLTEDKIQGLLNFRFQIYMRERERKRERERDGEIYR